MSWRTLPGGPFRPNDLGSQLDYRREIEEEIAFHLESRADDLIAEGVPEDEAKQVASRQFGDVDSVVSACLDTVDDHPLRVVLRRARSIGIGSVGLALVFMAAVIAFSVMVRQPATYHTDDEWVAIWWTHPSGDRHAESTLAEFERWRDQNTVFAEMALASYSELVYEDQFGTVRTRAKHTSQDYLDQHGMRPLIGRSFAGREPMIADLPGIVISHAFWEGRYGRDTGIVGQRVKVEGHDFVITGVAPPDFRMYYPTSFWVAYDFGQRRMPNVARHLASGRLKPGKNLDDVQRDLSAIVDAASSERWGTAGWTVMPRSTPDVYSSGVGSNVRLFLVLGCLLGFVLLLRPTHTSGFEVDRITSVGVALMIALVFGRWVSEAVLTGAAHRFDLGLGLVTIAALGLVAVAGMTLADRLARTTTGTRSILQFAVALLAVAMAVAASSNASETQDIEPQDEAFSWDPGTMISVSLPAANYRAPKRRIAFLGSVVDSLSGRGLSVSLVREWRAETVLIPGAFRSTDADSSVDFEHAEALVADSSWFGLHGLGNVSGRRIGSPEDSLAAPSLVLSSGLADALWPGAGPEEVIGRSVEARGTKIQFRVVGTVDHARPLALASIWQVPSMRTSIVLPAGASDIVRRDAVSAIAAVNRSVAVGRHVADTASGGTPIRPSFAAAVWLVVIVVLGILWQSVYRRARLRIRRSLPELEAFGRLPGSDYQMFKMLLRDARHSVVSGLIAGLPVVIAFHVLIAPALRFEPAPIWIYTVAAAIVVSVTGAAGLVPAVSATTTVAKATRDDLTELRSGNRIL